MSKFDDESRLPDELQDAARQIRAAKRQPTDDELARLKPSIPASDRPLAWRTGAMRGRLATAALTLVLIGGGGGAVIAASGGGAEKGLDPGASSAAQKQYCPPNSPGAGKPKPPGGNCGQGVGGQNSQGGQGQGNVGGVSESDPAQDRESCNRASSAGRARASARRCPPGDGGRVGGVSTSGAADADGGRSGSGGVGAVGADDGELPFTGLGLLALVIVGALLAGGGGAARRRLRRRP